MTNRERQMSDMLFNSWRRSYAIGLRVHNIWLEGFSTEQAFDIAEKEYNQQNNIK